MFIRFRRVLLRFVVVCRALDIKVQELGRDLGGDNDLPAQLLHSLAGEGRCAHNIKGLVSVCVCAECMLSGCRVCLCAQWFGGLMTVLLSSVFTHPALQASTVGPLAIKQEQMCVVQCQ